jgi:hypothetical protein
MKNNNQGFIYVPEWIQMLIVGFLIVGFFTTIAAMILSIIWLIKHIQFI